MTPDYTYDDTREPAVTERFYDRDLTGRERALKILLHAFRSLARLVVIALVLAPLQLFAIVTLDVPLGIFDRLAPTEGIAASRFMSSGEGMLMLVLLFSLLLTRRWGASVVGRALLLTWALTMVFVTMLIVELAPELKANDFPSARFIGVLIGSWLAGQLVAVMTYDLTRGGAWWRAPFFGALFGFTAQALIYFPGAFYGTGAPWPWWMATNLVLSAATAGVFVFLYGPVRKLITPTSGLGGR